MTTQTVDKPTPTERDWRPICHIGFEGDRVAICGASVLGIPATFGDPELCGECDEIWRGWPSWRRALYMRRIRW